MNLSTWTPVQVFTYRESFNTLFTVYKVVTLLTSQERVQITLINQLYQTLYSSYIPRKVRVHVVVEWFDTLLRMVTHVLEAMLFVIVIISSCAGMASLYSMVLVVSAWVWRIRNEREGDAEKEGEETPSKHLIVWVLREGKTFQLWIFTDCFYTKISTSCLVYSAFPLSAHYIILLVESVLFGVFVMVIFYDQVHTHTHIYKT